MTRDFTFSEIGSLSPRERVRWWAEQDALVDKIAHTIAIEYAEAYVVGARRQLTDGRGLAHLARLQDDDTRLATAASMTDHLLSRAKTMLGVPQDDGPSSDDPIRSGMLLAGTHGFSMPALLGELRQYGENYGIARYEDAREQSVRDVEARLRYGLDTYLRDEDVEELVRYAHAEAYIDTERMRVREAAAVARAYRMLGAVPRRLLENQIFYRRSRHE